MKKVVRASVGIPILYMMPDLIACEGPPEEDRNPANIAAAAKSKGAESPPDDTAREKSKVWDAAGHGDIGGAPSICRPAAWAHDAESGMARYPRSCFWSFRPEDADRALHDAYGFIASGEQATASAGGKEYTMSYQDMNLELTGGMWAIADPAVRDEAAAAREEEVLLRHRAVPANAAMDGALLFHCLTDETDGDLSNAGFGKPIMSMNDAEWEACVAENGGKLE